MPPSPRRPLLSVLIPAYNEERTIAELLRRVRAIEMPKEIIVVDGASTDGTREALLALPPSDPSDIRALYERYLAGDVAAVYGSRVLGPGRRRSSIFFYWGGRLVSLLTSVLYGTCH